MGKLIPFRSVRQHQGLLGKQVDTNRPGTARAVSGCVRVTIFAGGEEKEFWYSPSEAAARASGIIRVASELRDPREKGHALGMASAILQAAAHALLCVAENGQDA